MDQHEVKQDCEVLGRKHHLKFRGAAHVTMLTGQLWFDCRNCPAEAVVDRFYFYRAISFSGAR